MASPDNDANCLVTHAHDDDDGDADVVTAAAAAAGGDDIAFTR